MLAGVGLVLLVCAAYGLAATDARASTQTSEPNDADPLAQSSPAPSNPPNGAQQAAGTAQAAGSAASATQQQPTNVVITVRINSPGDDGPITQTNVVVAGANGSNSASTNQGGDPDQVAPSQDATTNQQAGATATASQDAAGNLVVVVRVNSPGNNGPISQTNAAVSGANAANTSTTNQGQPTAAAESAAPAPAAPRPSRRRAPDPPPKQPAAAPSAPRSAAPAAAPVVRHEAPAATAVARPHASQHPAVVPTHRQARPAGASSFHHGSITRPLRRVAAGAADVLNAVAPSAPVARPDSANPSRDVVYSLLIVLAALAVFIVWPQRPDWLRRVYPRTRLRG